MYSAYEMHRGHPFMGQMWNIHQLSRILQLHLHEFCVMSFFSSPKISVVGEPFVFLFCNIPKNEKRSGLIYAFKQSSLTIVAMSSYQFLILDQYKAKVKPLFQMTQLCSKVFKSQKYSYKSQKSQNTKNIWICAHRFRT